MALYFKQRGVILSKIKADKGEKIRINQDSLFSKALEFYQKVSRTYLEQSTDAFLQSFVFGNQQVKQVRRKADLFLYPDFFPKVRNERAGPARYFGDAFLSYLLKQKAFNELYTKEDDFELLNEWILWYDREGKVNWDHRLFRNFTRLDEPTLRAIDSIFVNNPVAKTLNANGLRMLLIDFYIERDNEEMINQVFQRMNLNRLKENFRRGGQQDQATFSFRMYRLAEYFALKGQKDDAIHLVQNQSNKINVIKVYSLVTLKLLKAEQPRYKEDAYVYLDSAITEFERIQDFLFVSNDPRIALVLTPALIGGKEMTDLAHRFVQAISISQQSGVIQNLILGISMRGDYYQAYSSIPEIALVDRLAYFNNILSEEGLRLGTDPEWRTYFDVFQNYWIWEVVGYEADIF